MGPPSGRESAKPGYRSGGASAHFPCTVTELKSPVAGKNHTKRMAMP